MTDNSEALLPCPFCGGKAERIDIIEGENAGGSCISCTCCLTSGRVEFGYKENFVSAWNTRCSTRPASVSDEVVERCERCGHENAVWFAPSPLWNAVMRGGCINGEPLFGDMVCAACFMSLAQAAGIAERFRVSAEVVNVPLQTTTPSGRVWDDQAWLWRDALSTRGDGDAVRPSAAIENLIGHQQQLDEHGAFVGVSRQALDEVLAYLQGAGSQGEGA